MNTFMNTFTKSRISKLIIGTSLSFTMLFAAASVTLPAPSAYAATTTSTASKIISTGKQFLGVPYKFGAKTGNVSSFDCSSFTQYVYKKSGINLPRSSKQQAKAGKYVSKSQLQPGDLVFSDTNRDGVINHVSIYIGNGQLLHTYRVGIGVTISKFAGSTWDKTYVTARRVL
ncbi:C40 family peptidase [Cohnella sp. WQ 127256]|uniref:C40 family peptidase n=1 Tax=Cohnella sp. WQ 127256 TaxID=2938790 RepID=UPI0021199FDF|nr:C40 family peptidase [Cohnella sp. WQ 127256]